MRKKTGVLRQATVAGPTITLRFEIPEPDVQVANEVDLDMIAKRLAAKPKKAGKLVGAYKQARSLNPLRHVVIALLSAKGYALEHIEERTADGKLIQTIDNADFVAYGPLWLPRHSTVRDYVRSLQFTRGFTEKPCRETKLALVDFSTGTPADVSFKLDYGTGAFVSDYSTVAAKQSPSVPGSFQPASDAQLRTAAAESRTSSRWRMLLIGNLIIFAAWHYSYMLFGVDTFVMILTDGCDSK